ncbi:AAA family ATPase [Micropruina sp.]|uniref:AAA family ATPase n=1 Tax=Micropruina sp. TaxID=2737536 RepID=UPI0039E27E7F
MTTELTVNLGDTTPRRLLVDWANSQDAWVRQLTAETILSRQTPGEDFLDVVYETFLVEKGLAEGDSPDIPKLEVSSVDTSEEEVLELAELSNVQGVNALASDQKLTFDPSLTVLFGQNGSGKTGYARIIKRISAVRAAEDILPNAHATYIDPPPAPSAQITYRLAGQDRAAQWSNQAGLAPFTRISVFDSNAVQLHVDSELGYVYTPAELALFGHVATGIRAIQDRIAGEASGLTPGTNPLLSKFARETKVYPIIETLGATTDLAELDALASVEADAEATHERLQSEINALRSNTVDAVLANTLQFAGDLKRLHALLSQFRGFNGENYKQALEAVDAAELRRAQAREELFAADELPGLPDDEWQDFITAGDQYRQHLGRDHYPQAGDACLYCMQPLSPAGLALVSRYRTFLDETLMQQVSTSRKALEQARLVVNDTEVARVRDFLQTRDGHASDADWVARAHTLLNDGVATSAETYEGKALTDTDLGARVEPVLAEVAATLTAATEAAEQLAIDKQNATTTIATKQRELAELGARIDLKNNLATAREYVRRAKRAVQLERLSKVISNGAAKQLTVQSKLASEDLVNKSFESLFAEECERLQAPPVALHFQGRSGKAQRKKAVANYRPSAVLSEGEQKVLALADFLAESRMRGTKAPLIFDDPVTSLDYRRLDEVAARIQGLAETHQVIVLTHNIMFASALISVRQNKRLRVKIYEVRDGGEAKGVLAPDVEPQLDTPADLAKRINVKLEHIPKADAIVQDALIKETYDLIRAWCEAFVEQELLCNVTQRYRHNIMMTKLSKIDATKLDAAVAVIEPLFARACDRMTGHSHAAEKMSTKPTFAELKQDWENGQAARKAYIG